MKSNKHILTTIFSIAFAFALCLTAVTDVAAQRYLTEVKTTSEVRGIARFAEDLNDFLKLADSIEANNSVNPIELGRLDAAAKKVKDGTSNLRTDLKGLIAIFKKADRWNDELDNQIADFIGGGSVKRFYKQNGGRKILTDADAASFVITKELDKIVEDVKKSKERSSTFSLTDGPFAISSFASSSSSKRGKLKCVILGIAILGAELAGANRTADNLDKYFDRDCGASANATT